MYSRMASRLSSDLSRVRLIAGLCAGGATGVVSAPVDGFTAGVVARAATAAFDVPGVVAVSAELLGDAGEGGTTEFPGRACATPGSGATDDGDAIQMATAAVLTTVEARIKRRTGNDLSGWKLGETIRGRFARVKSWR